MQYRDKNKVHYNTMDTIKRFHRHSRQWLFLIFEDFDKALFKNSSFRIPKLYVFLQKALQSSRVPGFEPESGVTVYVDCPWALSHVAMCTVNTR